VKSYEKKVMHGVNLIQNRIPLLVLPALYLQLLIQYTKNMLNVVQLLNTQLTLEQLASAANKSVMFDGMCVIEKSEKYVSGTRN